MKKQLIILLVLVLGFTTIAQPSFAMKGNRPGNTADRVSTVISSLSSLLAVSRVVYNSIVVLLESDDPCHYDGHPIYDPSDPQTWVAHDGISYDPLTGEPQLTWEDTNELFSGNNPCYYDNTDNEDQTSSTSPYYVFLPFSVLQFMWANSIANDETINGHIESPIRAEEFDRIVKSFKRILGIKSLRKSLAFEDGGSLDTLTRKRILQLLYSEPRIFEYLTRKNIESRGIEIVLNSKYEKSLYESDLRSDLKIPYRSKDGDFSVQQAFYCMGTPHPVCKGELPIAKTIFFEIQKSKISNLLDTNIEFLPPDNCDIYEKMNSVEPVIGKSPFQFKVLLGLSGHVHAFLKVFIYDSKTGEALFALLINSNELGFEYYSDRFEGYRNTNAHPLINCSLHLQTEKNDENCVIYSTLFARAFVDMLHYQAEESEIIFTGIDPKSKIFQERLANFVRSNIIRYLPEYYFQDKSGNFIMKSKQDIIDFHIQTRWEISNKWIYNFCSK